MIIKPKATLLLAACIVAVAAAYTVSAQRQKTTTTVKKPVATATPRPDVAVPQPTPQPPKKNERPTTGNSQSNSGNLNDSSNAVQKIDPAYRYEFTQPEFLISRVIIEHDENGKGSISFMRKGYNELISDPIELSPATVEKLNAAFAALNFIDSTENYQFERDFSHMGNIEVRRKKEGRERTAKYNWTSNKEAKFLMDEYRRIGNQFIWMFDVILARDNQPLESPKLFDSLDSMIKRNEIADPKQMVPFLLALGNDERIPLIGRNHAGKLIKQIEKERK